MSRLLWMGVGAAGGIYAYRRSQRVWERAKVRGVSGNATLLATTAAHWLTQLREAEQAGSRPRPAARST